MNPDAFARSVQLRHLRCLCAVADAGHLARAAERLALSQPAVSKTLAELEALAGAPLVLRHRSGARLTAAGEQLLQHARRALAAVGEAAGALAPAAGSERIAIGALPSAAPALLPAAIAALQRSRPRLQVALHTAPNAQLLAALQAGTLDVAVARMGDAAQMAGLAFELLPPEPLALLVRAGHPLAVQPPPRPAALLAWPWITYPAGTMPRQATDAWLAAHGLALPGARTETLDVATARLLAQQTDAVWATPHAAAAGDVAAGRLCVLPLALPGSAEPVGLLARVAPGGDGAALRSAVVAALHAAARLAI